MTELHPPYAAQAVARIEAWLRRYLILPGDEDFLALTLWIVHTWLIDCFHTTPRLVLTSPEPGCGKTRALDLVGMLARNAEPVSHISPAALFHRLGQGDFTLLLDEADVTFAHRSSGAEEMRGILDAGHVRGRSVMRRPVTGVPGAHAYQVFGPVAMAGLREPPTTVISRSVVIEMRRRRPDESVSRYVPSRVSDEAEELRGELERAAQLIEGCIDLEIDLPDGIEDRAADVWLPLLAIASALGEPWRTRAEDAAVFFVRRGAQQPPSEGVRLLSACRDIFDEQGTDQIRTTELLATIASSDVGIRRLDAQRLAALLRPYDVKPKALGSRRVRGVRGYDRAAFEDAWARYLPPVVPSAASGADPAALASSDPPQRVAGIAGVAGVAGGEGPVVPIESGVAAREPAGELAMLWLGGEAK